MKAALFALRSNDLLGAMLFAQTFRLIFLFSRFRIYPLQHARLLTFELLILLRIFLIEFNGEL